MRLLCMIRLCKYDQWKKIESSSIEADGEWVRQSAYLRRECRHCGRRQERSVSNDWQGYHMGSEFETPTELSSDEAETPVEQPVEQKAQAVKQPCSD